MEDIFHFIREGNAIQVRMWLDDTEHDMNQGDDHQFSPLHWAAKGGHLKILEMLISRGARVHTTNMGDDTPLHLAAAHGHRDVVTILVRQKAEVNSVNEHGNTPLHYACFWGYTDIAEDLIEAGALVTIQNKYQETPLDKCAGHSAARLQDRASQSGQDMKIREYKDQSWLGLKTRSRDATLSRHKGININELYLHTKIATTPSGQPPLGAASGHRIDCVSDEELVARINMADAKFSFQEKGKMYHPAWIAPEALKKSPADINSRAADMWSYAIMLWEMSMREVPFGDLSPMEAGMRIATEGLRLDISPGVSPHMAKLIKICMNEDPGKRPTFDMIIPILEKMKK